MELAVFGVMCLAALGFLIRIGMKANYDQEIRMAAFRRAMAAAQADNGTDADSVGTLYEYLADRQMPDPNDGFMMLPRARTEASAYVEWGDRLTMAYGDGDPSTTTPKGRLTQEHIIVNVNGADTDAIRPGGLRAEDFAESGTFSDGIGPPVVVTAIPRAIDGYTMDNTVGSADITQTRTSSDLSSATNTSSTTRINTKSGDSISSGVSSNSHVHWDY